MIKYIKYVFENKEPLRIADDSRSQSGQMVTLRYVPGTTIRGYVVNQLAKQANFETVKLDLFSNKVCYLNAYISKKNQELIPSPKGFYEEKNSAEKKIDNIVVNGEFEKGYKRAALGRYCYLEQNCIHYYNVETGSDLKIKINLEDGEKQNVFRNEYIEPGYQFTGYIAIKEDEEALIASIQSVFGEEILLGNARSSGFGKCRIISCELTDSLPYQSFMAEADQTENCYMMLLSNTSLRNQKGEICGFDEEMLAALGEKMNVENLQIRYCATSTVTVRGYNRTWGVKIPSMVAYEQGSVFHLTYNGTLTFEKMKKLMDEGIGIRRNEGFGRILFLKEGYENIITKQSENYFDQAIGQDILPNMLPDDKKVIRIAARSYYKRMIQGGLQKFALENKAKLSEDARTSASQLGMLDSIITAHQYDPQNAIQLVRNYLAESEDRENNNRSQNQHNSLKAVSRFIETEIFDKKIEDIAGAYGKKAGYIMGLPVSELLSDEQENRMKLALILDLIRFQNKDKGEK